MNNMFGGRNWSASNNCGSAHRLGAVLLDSDEVTERLVRAGLELAGMNPDDRDSPAYKKAYRDAVYETLFDLGRSHLKYLPVVIAGPFTREGGEGDWPERLKKLLGVMPSFHYVWCSPQKRRERVMARGEERDGSKLKDWENHVAACREEPPVFPHQWVVTG